MIPEDNIGDSTFFPMEGILLLLNFFTDLFHRFNDYRFADPSLEPSLLEWKN